MNTTSGPPSWAPFRVPRVRPRVDRGAGGHGTRAAAGMCTERAFRSIRFASLPRNSSSSHKKPFVLLRLLHPSRALEPLAHSIVRTIDGLRAFGGLTAELHLSPCRARCVGCHSGARQNLRASPASAPFALPSEFLGGPRVSPFLRRHVSALQRPTLRGGLGPVEL